MQKLVFHKKAIFKPNTLTCLLNREISVTKLVGNKNFS